MDSFHEEFVSLLLACEFSLQLLIYNPQLTIFSWQTHLKFIHDSHDEKTKYGVILRFHVRGTFTQLYISNGGTFCESLRTRQRCL